MSVNQQSVTLLVGEAGVTLFRVTTDMSLHQLAIVDETVRIYGRKDLLFIGANTRIDAYCVITVGDAGVRIGDNVHIGVGVYLFGSGGKIEIGNRCSLSPRSTIYTASDDFRKLGLIGPCNPTEERNVIQGDVVMEEGSALGHGAVMFPGSVLEKWAAVGAYVTVKGRFASGQVVTRAYQHHFTERV